MFVCVDARAALAASQRQYFLEHEWPGILTRLSLLGLHVSDLPGQLPGQLPDQLPDQLLDKRREK